jgi:CheY-like chemotaxis protein
MEDSMARILVIDDEEMLLETVEEILKDEGHDVVTAHDGVEGMAAFRRQPIDLVITDIFMPGKEGIETILDIRDRTPTLPIIAISGGGDSGNPMYLKAAGRAGATKTLAKPFEPDQLARLVAECLGAAA